MAHLIRRHRSVRSQLAARGLNMANVVRTLGFCESAARIQPGNGGCLVDNAWDGAST